ncbi:MAG TPA: hypothetical protein VFR47_19830 [Anaerolineales bacterium]|nr:hypothetical protein [Anaerolineales bacterium]
MARYRIYILGLVVLLFLLSVGCTQPALQDSDIPARSESTPSGSEIRESSEAIVTPSIVPTLFEPQIEMMVPYSKTSIWNTPIGPSPKYDPYSQAMIATLVLSNDGKIITAGDTHNYPVYFVDADTPRWDVSCTIYKCRVHTPEGGVRTDMVNDIPIPPDARPSADSDARMIIIDKDTYAEYDFWRAQRLETGWTAGGVSAYNIRWNGTPSPGISRGSGIPSYAGLLRPWEIRQGRIQHALAFGYTETAKKKCVFPASKTDGDSKLPFAIPEGARLQLDPFLTDTDFDQMGLDPTEKIIARALQEYGMILVDTSGSFKIYVEDLINNPFATEDWSDPGLNLTKESIYNIPYTAFRVLELPPGYWEPDEAAVYHGKCLAFPKVP